MNLGIAVPISSVLPHALSAKSCFCDINDQTSLERK
jgi:hypothetical protein